MKSRLYFLAPDLPAAEQIMNDLLLARVEDRNVHCLAKRGSNLGSLNEASYLHKSDLAHGAQLGLAIGGIGGILLGLAVVVLPWGGRELPLGVVLGTGLGGAFFGAWSASLIGASTPNSKLAAFASDIERGSILMIVDVPVRRVAEIRELMDRKHPEAMPRGIEPMVPAFP